MHCSTTASFLSQTAVRSPIHFSLRTHPRLGHHSLARPFFVSSQGLDGGPVDPNDPNEFAGFGDALRKILKHQGVGGLFSGMVPAAVKQLITQYIFYYW